MSSPIRFTPPPPPLPRPKAPVPVQPELGAGLREAAARAGRDASRSTFELSPPESPGPGCDSIGDLGGFGTPPPEPAKCAKNLSLGNGDSGQKPKTVTDPPYLWLGNTFRLENFRQLGKRIEELKEKLSELLLKPAGGEATPVHDVQEGRGSKSGSAPDYSQDRGSSRAGKPGRLDPDAT
ncbi:hypothetical protein G4177_11215 [Corallococcus sp. ZKHCc1 1396]|uniref:Uncharacterized protein n=2 Tax=Corallococcus soli TaxID=2710757 RepID=A0ABR9PLG6_9BACT|nr:hypothetical protein [Corallococcus soli]MBE4748731.1 hypothetical protein [Corallococcus soli]